MDDSFLYVTLLLLLSLNVSQWMNRLNFTLRSPRIHPCISGIAVNNPGMMVFQDVTLFIFSLNDRGCISRLNSTLSFPRTHGCVQASAEEDNAGMIASRDVTLLLLSFDNHRCMTLFEFHAHLSSYSSMYSSYYRGGQFSDDCFSRCCTLFFFLSLNDPWCMNCSNFTLTCHRFDPSIQAIAEINAGI